MVCNITSFSTLLPDLLFRFLARSMPIPTYILPKVLLYLYPLLPYYYWIIRFMTTPVSIRCQQYTFVH